MNRIRSYTRAHPLRAWVIAAVLVSIVLRLAFVLVTLHWIPESDNRSYFDKATYFYLHLGLAPAPGPHGSFHPDAYWPPVFPIVMAAAIELHTLARALGFGRAIGVIPWVRLMFSLLDAVTIVPALALIARRLAGPRTAFAAAGLAAVFPPLIFVGASNYSEALFVPLELFAVVAMLEYRLDRRWGRLVAAGLLTGLSALTHSEGLALLIPLLIAAWPGGGLWDHRRLARGLRPAAVLLAATLVLVVPWTVRNAVDLHAFEPVSTSFGNTLAGTYNASSAATSPPGRWRDPLHMRQFRWVYQGPDGYDEVKQNSALEHAGLRYIGSHPGYVPELLFWNTVRLLEFEGPGYSQVSAKLEGVPYWATWIGDLCFYAVLVLAVAGCFTRAARAAPRWVWLTPLLMYLAVVLLNAETPRFRAPIDPFLLLLAAFALTLGRKWALEDHFLPRVGRRDKVVPPA